MTAGDHLSPNQFARAIGPGEQLPMFMTPHEISGMMSADYGGQMHEVPQRMRDAYAHQAEKEALHGHTVGPSKLDRLSAQVQADGGIHTPARIVHLPSGVASLYNGHHRGVVAIEQNRLLPVDHYFDHKSGMAAVHRDNGEPGY